MPPARFSVGVNYWPQRSAHAMWDRFDAGAIAEDFARIAALNLDTVRFFLRWDTFQPNLETIDPRMLDRLERFVDLADAAGLRTMPTLFCGSMDGANYLPPWVVDRARPARRPTISGGVSCAYGAGDFYAGSLLEAQVRLARSVAERLASHPAVFAWDIGHAFSDVCEPSHAKVSSGSHGADSAAEPRVAAWSARISGALREISGHPVTAGTFFGDLTADRDIRLGSLCASLTFASMQGGTVDSAFARNRLDLEAVPFLAMLTAGFSYKPVLISGFGNPTCPPNTFSLFEHFAEPGAPPLETISAQDSVFSPYPCLNENENALFCRAVLERLHADGRLGAYWWCWADYDNDLTAHPSFDGAPWTRTNGLIRSDGTEKPVATALADFAGEGRTVRTAHDMPMISSTYYYRTLPRSTGTLYDAYLGFVEERRA